MDDDQSRLQRLEAEIQEVEEEIRERRELLKQLRAEQSRLLQRSQAPGYAVFGSSNHKPPSRSTDYTKADFPWSGELLPRAQETWPVVRSFRSVQEAVCNAAMDGRDTIVVMPTGGGKSLCYQLPAIFDTGLTLVISPLISLSMDQLWHLREAGVNCEMLSSAVAQEEARSITNRIKSAGRQPRDDDIKVLFVTPEKVVQNKTLKGALQRCFENGRLSRIVIDEAHCCSQMGHDFRPDYSKLTLLRKAFPSVPIMCLSATLAPKVLHDVRQILDLPPVTEPSGAAPGQTVYFTAPLYRPNLQYRVVSRPNGSKEAAATICDWILANHAGESGIVYSLSKKDTEAMAASLEELSQGRIRAAWYHADMFDADKTSIHQRWRANEIQVVCATTAFGMGIDKGDVRFVAHASCGKSLDSYYQETGRAGRDGALADCVLFYRPQDATRLSAITISDKEGTIKLHSMLEYAQSAECRKRLLGRYFETFDEGANTDCGHCDNCVERPSRTDVSFEAWQMLKVMEEIDAGNGRVSLAQLCELARGLHSGRYTVVERKDKKSRRRKSATSLSGQLDLDDVCGGKMALSKDNAERLAVALLLKGYLGDEHVFTAYTTNVYMRCTPQALRLTRHTLDTAKSLKGLVETTLLGGGGGGAAGGTQTRPTSSRPTASGPRASSGAKAQSLSQRGAKRKAASTARTEGASSSKSSRARGGKARASRVAKTAANPHGVDDGYEDEGGESIDEHEGEITVVEDDAEQEGKDEDEDEDEGGSVRAAGKRARRVPVKTERPQLEVRSSATTSSGDVKWAKGGFADDPLEIYSDSE